MKFFLRLFLFLAFGFSFIFASNVTETKEILLKKDEQKKILVKYANKEKLFQFRWTLYKNGGLVVFRSYDKIVAQSMLYLRHENQSFRVELKTKGATFHNAPYILVKFKEFKQDSKQALFEIFLFDEKEQISLEELKK
ncbi:hypothetical protein [Sulfurimonas sp.]|uniref:hypothetical protein n=1 Tax=Sulfurimonas sp. TaxID=2022749 RepID=UPI0026082B74|nr:hypothetical protein [Sulfurimonas sp.]